MEITYFSIFMILGLVSLGISIIALVLANINWLGNYDEEYYYKMIDHWANFFSLFGILFFMHFIYISYGN